MLLHVCFDSYFLIKKGDNDSVDETQTQLESQLWVTIKYSFISEWKRNIPTRKKANCYSENKPQWSKKCDSRDPPSPGCIINIKHSQLILNTRQTSVFTATVALLCSFFSPLVSYSSVRNRRHTNWTHTHKHTAAGNTLHTSATPRVWRVIR